MGQEESQDLISKCQNLTPADLKGYRKIFEKYAADGEINYRGLQSFLEEVQFSGTVDYAMLMMDTDHNGKLSFEEYATWMDTEKSISNEARLQKMFQNLDRDSSGFIDFDEFVIMHHIIGYMFNGQVPTLEETQAQFDAVDTDHNGKISYEEIRQDLSDTEKARQYMNCAVF